MIKRFEVCPFCDGYIVPRSPRANIWKCLSCRLLFRNPLPSGQERNRLYDEAWSSPFVNTSETGGTDLDLARIYAKKLVNSLNLKDFGGLKILDFGTGRGAMLTALAELGADVYGIEPFGYEFLESQGFKAFRVLEDLPEGLLFDGIITIDVIEHLTVPWNEIRRLKKILAESGWIYIATLNSDGLNAKIYRSKWREALKPGHLFFFSPHSLKAILSASGFTRCHRLRWFIQYSKNPIRKLVHFLLQALYLEGELSYLVYKS